MAFGESRKWFVPYYLDVGTGESDLTWQAMGGIGYSLAGATSSRPGVISTTT